MQTGRPPTKAEVAQSIAEYQMCLQLVGLSSIAIAKLDIERMLAAISHAESIGPIVDPTLWRDKSEKMAEDKKMLQAALPLAQIGRRLLEQRDQGKTVSEIVLPK